MPAVRITDVVVDEVPLDFLHGANLETPDRDAASEVYSFDVEGWALSRASPVSCVEILQQERPVLEVPVDRKRRDIGSAWSDAAGAERSGFKAQVGALHLRSRFELVLRIRLEDGTRLPFAHIEGERRTLPAGGVGEIQPLLVSTLGRSGSTWLVWLLGRHPEILAYVPYRRDVRVATYWMSVLKDLARPRSYHQQFDPGDVERPHWWLGDQEPIARELPDPPVEGWLGREEVESLAAMCRARIDAVYARVGRSEAREDARYFVEKSSPAQVEPDLLSELYPGARELILVRDFRDMLCSVLAFNAKRGYAAFGREQAGSDAEYLTSTIRPMAQDLLECWRRRNEAAYLVRYEELVLDPERTLDALLRYLELDATDEEIERMLARASAPQPGMSEHLTAGDPAASVGRWRRDLSDELAELCEEELGPALAEFGYPVSAGPAPEAA